MAKKHMPLYGIVGIFKDFLTHTLAKYQYCSIRPSLFVTYYQYTYSLLVSTQYIVKYGFYGQKTQKMHKIGHISV